MKFEISPLTQTSPRWRSMMRRAEDTRSDTGNTAAADGSVGADVARGGRGGNGASGIRKIRASSGRFGQVREDSGKSGKIRESSGRFRRVRNSRFDNAYAATGLSKTHGRRKVVTTLTSAAFSHAGIPLDCRSGELAKP